MPEKEPKETIDLRYKDSLPLQRYRVLTIGIAGLGAIGRQAATILASMGHKKLYGADFDKVELKNLGTQGWNYEDIGEYKSKVLMRDLTTKHSSFNGFAGRFEHCPNRSTNVFFCCVDNMAARHDIWKRVTGGNCPDCGGKGRLAPIELTNVAPTSKGITCPTCKGKKDLYGLYIDARMIPGVIRVLATDLGDVKARKYYETTLYNDNQAFEGACTDRMTMFGAYIAGGLMVSQLVNWLNGVPLVRDFLLETQRMTSTYLDPQAVEEGNARKVKR